MLTLTQLQTRLSQLTYRPGWTMELREGAFEGSHLIIHAVAEDTTKPGENIVLDVHSTVPPMLSLEQFDLFIAHRLIRIEIHESREFLRLKSNGKALFYPHVQDADQDLYDIDKFREYRWE